MIGVTSAMWAAKPRGRISFICRADRAGELIHLFYYGGRFRNSAISALAAANGAGWAGNHSGTQGSVSARARFYPVLSCIMMMAALPKLRGGL